jgi:hypothetical protein
MTRPSLACTQRQSARYGFVPPRPRWCCRSAPFPRTGRVLRAIAIEAEITADPRDENAASLDGPEIRLSQTMSALPHFVLLGTGPSKGSSPRTTSSERDFPFLQKAPCLVTPPR